MPVDPFRYQCAFCRKPLVDRADIVRHEADCEAKKVKRAYWALMLRVAYARERTNGKTK